MYLVKSGYQCLNDTDALRENVMPMAAVFECEYLTDMMLPCYL